MILIGAITLKPMWWQEKWRNIYDKYFFNPFPVSSKILLKFFKINNRYHPDISYDRLHVNRHKKAQIFFKIYELT